ncbi:ABC transporter substrate-binding protein [Deinococcus altitudinis]|uniref:ABC transporter substrate-binding protein n=1 Tax=Deinococcus altitudinis TaxID=468914 RepID=UPI0038926ADE
MKLFSLTVSLALLGTAFQAQAQTASSTKLGGTVTVWSWDSAAKGLQSTVPGFNKLYPNVKVNVVDLGNQNVYDRGLAGCAAGGADLPDVYSIENGEAEVFWARFPDCFTDLTSLGADKIFKNYPAFKWSELSVGSKRYAMPWDSGAVVMFYRRDLYQKAGINPASIRTWADFEAAGKKMASKGVKMGTIANGGDDEWFRMLANQNGCYYFNATATQITINQPGCVSALSTVQRLNSAGILATGDWNTQITNVKTSRVAGSLYGAWYEGTIRTNAPDQSGKWGVYLMPAAQAGGRRAANLGGSALALPAASKNKDAAWAFMQYALGTTQGQVTMLKADGLVPSLLSATKDPYISQAQPYWGNQKIWQTVLGTLPQIQSVRGSQFYQDAHQIMVVVQSDLLKGKYKTSKEALDDAASKIASATGLPMSK